MIRLVVVLFSGCLIACLLRVICRHGTPALLPVGFALKADVDTSSSNPRKFLLPKEGGV